MTVSQDDRSARPSDPGALAPPLRAGSNDREENSKVPSWRLSRRCLVLFIPPAVRAPRKLGVRRGNAPQTSHDTRVYASTRS